MAVHYHVRQLAEGIRHQNLLSFSLKFVAGRNALPEARQLQLAFYRQKYLLGQIHQPADIVIVSSEAAP